jgi:hypothetical protein
MPLGYLVKGQRVADQPEDNFVAGQGVVGKTNVPGGQLRISNVAIGGVAYSSL